MEQIELRVTGLSPLLMQADRLANPLDPVTVEHKKLTSKKKKTEEDHIAIARSEFIAALYLHKDAGVVIPGQNFDGSFRSAAALRKLRTQWDRACLVVDDYAKLIYDGPRTPEALWNDRDFVDARSVVVSNRRVIRYRPIFHRWACEITLSFDPEMLSRDEVMTTLHDAGRYIHIGTFRRRFGRFTVDER